MEYKAKNPKILQKDEWMNELWFGVWQHMTVYANLSCGPALMARCCFGALRIAAARLILLHACSATVWLVHWRAEYIWL